MLFLKGFNKDEFLNKVSIEYYDQNNIIIFFEKTIMEYLYNDEYSIIKNIGFRRKTITTLNDVIILLYKFVKYFNEKANYGIKKMHKVVSEVYDDKHETKI